MNYAKSHFQLYLRLGGWFVPLGGALPKAAGCVDFTALHPPQSSSIAPLQKYLHPSAFFSSQTRGSFCFFFCDPDHTPPPPRHNITHIHTCCLTTPQFSCQLLLVGFGWPLCTTERPLFPKWGQNCWKWMCYVTLWQRYQSTFVLFTLCKHTGPWRIQFVWVGGALIKHPSGELLLACFFFHNKSEATLMQYHFHLISSIPKLPCCFSTRNQIMLLNKAAPLTFAWFGTRKEEQLELKPTHGSVGKGADRSDKMKNKRHR